MTELSNFWHAGIEDGDDKAVSDRVHQLLQAQPIIRLLVQRLEADLAADRAKRLAAPAYDSAGWAYQMADANGHERAKQILLDRLKEVCYTS